MSVRLIVSFSAATLVGLLIACSAAVPASAYRSMTWNIGGGPTSNAGHQFNLNDVQAVLSRYSPDVVALQEVCSWQAKLLGQSLGYYWHETAISRFDDGRTGLGGTCDYGDALLSKTELPVNGRYRTDLLAPSEGCKYDAYQGSGFPECRLDMGALITPSGGSVVRAASAHVGTAGEPYTPPYDQSLELSRLVNDATNNANEAATARTALMMGDYNVRPEDSRMAPKFVALGYTDAGGSVGGQTCATTPGCELTYPSGGSYGAPATKSDYIYYRNLRLDAHQVPEPQVNGHEASDHRPIVADFSSLLAPPPAVTLLAPSNGSSQNRSSPRFDGTASTASGSSAVTLKIYSGPAAAGPPVQAIGGVPVRSDGSWSAQAAAPLADGIYTVRAEQTDAGSRLGSSGANTFTVDTAAPQVTLTSPTNGSSTKSSTPTFRGAAGTSSGDATSVTVKIYSGAAATGTQIQTLSAPVSDGSWSIVSPALAAGTYTATAEQTDAAGNTGLSSPNTWDQTQGDCPGEFGSVNGCPVADLQLTMTASQRIESNLVTYTLAAENNGPDPVPDAVVSDTLPSGATIVTSSGSGGSCSASGRSVSCVAGALASRASSTITITARLKAGRQTNSATISSAALTQAATRANGAGESNPANNAASATVNVASPAVSSAKATPSTFRQGPALPKVSRRPPVGTTISFNLSAPATATLMFSQPQTGRKVGRRCRSLTRANRSKPRCMIPNVRGTLTFSGHPGTNRIRFQGRLSRSRKLRPGRYTLTITATDSAGNHSSPRSTGFTILP